MPDMTVYHVPGPQDLPPRFQGASLWASLLRAATFVGPATADDLKGRPILKVADLLRVAGETVKHLETQLADSIAAHHREQERAVVAEARLADFRREILEGLAANNVLGTLPKPFSWQSNAEIRAAILANRKYPATVPTMALPYFRGVDLTNAAEVLETALLIAGDLAAALEDSDARSRAVASGAPLLGSGEPILPGLGRVYEIAEEEDAEAE